MAQKGISKDVILAKALEMVESYESPAISMRELAEELAKIGEVELKFELPSELEKNAFNPMVNSSLNSEKLCSLGWKGWFDYKLGLEHTVKIIKEAKV